MRHILLATDGSESAARATKVTVMALAGGGKLSILTVEGHATEDVKQFARAEGSVGDAIEGLANQILHQARESAHKAGVGDVEVQSAWGDTAEVIIDKARRDKVDVIVVGRRGRGRLTGLLLGSVSQKLVSLASCAVVVVP
ncbi:universal stress protein [Neorhizobium phenanthreniclasticum]